MSLAPARSFLLSQSTNTTQSTNKTRKKEDTREESDEDERKVEGSKQRDTRSSTTQTTNSIHFCHSAPPPTLILRQRESILAQRGGENAWHPAATLTKTERRRLSCSVLFLSPASFLSFCALFFLLRPCFRSGEDAMLTPSGPTAPGSSIAFLSTAHRVAA
eukprot:3594817-Rhodomonas_salina.1